MIALALSLITIRSLDAPLLLYPSSASIPAGLYVRSFEPIRPGVIVAFSVPKIARLYQERNGTQVPSGYVFIKPVAAGPGDQVCNDPLSGLKINGVWVAAIASADNRGNPLPSWHLCRWLADGEFFLFSGTVPNSFDSRYFGVVPASQILATYRQIP